MVEVQPSLGPAAETANARDEQSDGMGRRKRVREVCVYVVRIKRDFSDFKEAHGSTNSDHRIDKKSEHDSFLVTIIC